MKNLNITFFASLALAVFAQADKPRNVILMIGDGMGFNQLKATANFINGTDSTVLLTFPVKDSITTYSYYGSYSADSVKADATYVNKKPTDSAASGTAFSTGIKTYDAALGMSIDTLPLVTIVEKSAQQKMSTGLVTTVQISHATPASMVAHNKSRKNYPEIAREMIENSALDVLVGAGHPLYNDDANLVVDSLQNFEFVGGVDLWKKLTTQTAKHKDGRTWKFYDKNSQIDSLSTGKISAQTPLLIVPQVRETLQMNRAAHIKANALPNLTQLSLVAINALQKNTKKGAGFFLMIEGGAIDWAGHANNSPRLIEEGVDFLDAVNAVIAWIQKNDQFKETLLIVTADHETGYLTQVQNQGKNKMPSFMWNSKNHTNQRVPFFAKGPFSEQFIAKPSLLKPADHKEYLDNATIGKLLHLAVTK